MRSFGRSARHRSEALDRSEKPVVGSKGGDVTAARKGPGQRPLLRRKISVDQGGARGFPAPRGHGGYASPHGAAWFPPDRHLGDHVLFRFFA